MMKFLVGFMFFGSMGFAQIQEQSFAEIDSLQPSNPKHHIVFIYTDWCKYCHLFKKSTLKEDSVIELVNKSFYFTTLNAETEKTIRFKNHDFKYTPNGNGTGVHELALTLGKINNELVYPTTVILNTKNEIVFKYNQLLSEEELIVVLKEVLSN